uniref:Uncharacterized protein n=1 Tax=viral metagenome TaxID=1070528 RepID=A0A6C0AD90_9ZZZZ
MSVKYYKDIVFFDEIFLQRNQYENSSDIFNRRVQEIERQKIIIDMFEELLEILKELEKNEGHILYNETVELVHKYYSKIEKISHIIFSLWHRGMLYCPENSSKYILVKKECENYLCPFKENVIIDVGSGKYFGNEYY